MNDKEDKIYKNINGIQIELNEGERKEYYSRLEEHEKNFPKESKPVIKKRIRVLKNVS